MNAIEMEIRDEAIYTLKILSQNTEDLFDEITNLATSIDSKFQHIPVILEIENKHFQANELAVLIEVLTQNNMVVVGIRSSIQELLDFAKFSGLAVFSKPIKILKAEQTNNPNKEKKPVEPKKITNQTKPSKRLKKIPYPYSNNNKIIVSEVQSSEQVLAKDSDLVLLGPVQVDAEVIAYGSIVARKKMQGKIFAGIEGNEKATIFIQSFAAQLVSIAGIYRQFESIPSKLFQHSVMVDLHNKKLRFKVV